MRDAVLVLLVAGVAYVIYKMTKGNDASPQPLGELAELSDTAKQLAASDAVAQFTLSSSLVKPRVTFEERVRIAGQGDASMAGGDTSSSAADLPGLEDS